MPVELQGGADTYMFFNKDVNLRTPEDARQLAHSPKEN